MHALRFIAQLFAVASVSAALLVPSTALACACCDGGGSRRVVGWSTSGRSALVEHDEWAGCEHRRSHEVWRPSSPGAPVHCFDHYAVDPDAVTGCGYEDLTAEYDASDAGRTARTPTRDRFFPKPVRAVRPELVRAVLTRASTPIDDASCLEEARLTVTLRPAPSAPLLSVPVCLGAPEDVAGELADGEWMVNPIEVQVFPSPDAQRALVFWSGQDGAPGLGDFDTAVRMVTLPSSLHDPRLLAPMLVPGPHAESVTALPPTGRRAEPSARRFANLANRAGLSAHRAGDYARAQGAFMEAIWRDHGHVFAWYNLACAEARQGHRPQAIDILRILSEWRCSGCRERLRRAATDPDLASLMSDPEVRRILATASD